MLMFQLVVGRSAARAVPGALSRMRPRRPSTAAAGRTASRRRYRPNGARYAASTAPGPPQRPRWSPTTTPPATAPSRSWNDRSRTWSNYPSRSVARRPRGREGTRQSSSPVGTSPSPAEVQRGNVGRRPRRTPVARWLYGQTTPSSHRHQARRLPPPVASGSATVEVSLFAAVSRPLLPETEVGVAQRVPTKDVELCRSWNLLLPQVLPVNDIICDYSMLNWRRLTKAHVRRTIKSGDVAGWFLSSDK